MHQNQQLIQYDRVSSTFFSINRLFFYYHHFNSWFLSDLIWSNEISSAPISIIDFIQINISIADFFWSNEDSVSTPFYHRFIQINFFNSWFFLIKWGPRQHSFLSSIHTDQFFQQLTLFWSNENSASIPFYHRFIQVKFWSFSAEIILRKQRYMKIFDDFHIEKYFHLFFFMNWILNFISFHSINEMNKWSILIIYSFMK